MNLFGNFSYNYNYSVDDLKTIDNNNFIITIKHLNDSYNINIKKEVEFSKILMTCNLTDDILSLYDYYLELSFEDFIKLGNSFRQCNDINDIFLLLKNVMSEIKITTRFYNKENYSFVKLTNINNELELILTIPLLTGEKEEITLFFEKKERDPINLE